MGPNYLERVFQKWEIAVAKNLVRQFQETCPSLKRDFIDDLTYECLQHWFFEKDKYDLQRIEKPKKFLAKVVSNKLCDLIRERSAKKRSGYFLAESLDQFLEENPSSPFLSDKSETAPAEKIDQKDIQVDLTTKLSQIFKQLTSQQKKVFLALRDEQLTITQISLRLKVHRSTVHNEINRMREIFAHEGLRKFIK